MTTEKSQLPSVTPPAMESCRKKKTDDATFLQDVKDHIDEFVHASMDEHKTCFKKTISKMFGMSKVVAERNAAENKGIGKPSSSDHLGDTKMTTEKSQLPSVTPPAMESCRKKKTDDATFLQDVKDHIDEFVHASMDEHKTCFKKTISKMFGMSKVVAERNAAENKGVESSLPLRTVVSD